jgi:KDO2-lipid IV(A) lauroyltransferase
MLTLIRWLARWPLWLLHWLGAVLGWLVYLLSARYRARFRANVAQAGVPARSARAAVAQAGRLVAETPRLWLGPPLSDAGLVQVRGAEWLESVHASGRGLLMLTPHLGCFEVIAQAYAERYAAQRRMTVMYRPARQPWLADLERTARDRPGLAAVPATLSGVREMVRALRRGQTVGLLPDQVPPQGLGVWVPFFGRPAYTMTLAARLVQQTGAELCVAWGERLPRGRGFRVHFEPFEGAAELAREDPAESAARVNRVMERLILASPQQYLWGYDRYKSPRQLDAAVAASGEATP